MLSKQKTTNGDFYMIGKIIISCIISAIPSASTPKPLPYTFPSSLKATNSIVRVIENENNSDDFFYSLRQNDKLIIHKSLEGSLEHIDDCICTENSCKCEIKSYSSTLVEDKAKAKNETIELAKNRVKEIKDYKSGEVQDNADYQTKKQLLDKKYSQMFELQKQLYELSEKKSAKWQEYKSLKKAYKHELNAMVRHWASQNVD